METLPKVSGNDLRRFRVYKGFDQKNAAFVLGISQPAYSKWENSMTLSEEKLARLISAFGANLNELNNFLKSF